MKDSENIITTTAIITMLLMLILFVAVLFITAPDTSDWFEPKTENATLEVQHNGTGQTVNPQLTKDAAELQGSE